ncbi:hypothetical protein F5Y06DRAFT_307559 [Hypoxylon sp. FL0890]|nr:hypothetical protein F5Y06DRAFT_307559 [Hypoxylon sp. FL0890]
MSRAKKKAPKEQRRRKRNRKYTHERSIEKVNSSYSEEVYPALPLSPSIRARVGEDFDVKLLLKPAQKQLNHAIYILYSVYIPSQRDKTARLNPAESMTLDRVRALVEEIHCKVMGTIQSDGHNHDPSFWSEDLGVKHLLPQLGVQILQKLSLDAVTHRLWQLCALDVFWAEISTTTFTGGRFFHQSQKPSDKKFIMNRALYRAFIPFLARESKFLNSPKELASIVRCNMEEGIESMKNDVQHFHGRFKRYAGKAATLKPEAIVARMVELWYLRVFHCVTAYFNQVGLAGDYYENYKDQDEDSPNKEDNK